MNSTDTSNCNSTVSIQKQQDTYNQINTLLQQSTSSLLCGPTCQKQQTEDKLKQEYLDAEVNIQTAPSKLDETKKNYYIFSKGEAYYNEMQEKELQRKAEMITQTLKKQFDDQVKQAETLNYYYNTDLINSKNTQELYSEYRSKNKNIERNIRVSNNDILTNDRKTYYETQEIDDLEYYYNILFVVYYVVVVILSIFILFFKTEMSFMLRLFLVILFSVLPYLLNWVCGLLYNMYLSISSYLPKNVYNNI
jgi:hypothetical protein